MAIKMMVFDIDGTIARTEEGILPHIGARLRALESKGMMIALISGRTASYLAGLARGIGITRPLVAGENGGVIFDPINFREKSLNLIPQETIAAMKTIILQQFAEIWFQPNQTMLTAAPLDRSRIEELYETIVQLKPVQEYGYRLTKYDDSVEVMPKENSKGKALAVIRDLYQIRRDEVIAIGNTVVDLPMKAEAKEFIYIGDGIINEAMKDLRIQEKDIRKYSHITDALDYLEESCIS